MKQPVFKLPNSLTILKKYKKQSSTAGDENKDAASENGAEPQYNQEPVNLNPLDKKEPKEDEPKEEEPKEEEPKEDEPKEEVTNVEKPEKVSKKQPSKQASKEESKFDKLVNITKAQCDNNMALIRECFEDSE